MFKVCLGGSRFYKWWLFQGRRPPALLAQGYLFLFFIQSAQIDFFELSKVIFYQKWFFIKSAQSDCFGTVQGGNTTSNHSSARWLWYFDEVDDNNFPQDYQKFDLPSFTSSTKVPCVRFYGSLMKLIQMSIISKPQLQTTPWIFLYSHHHFWHTFSNL